MTHNLKSYSFKKIDAFARGLSGGNPAGAVYLAPEEAITPREMQKIAYELKGFVSEVGFVRLPEPGLVELRYFLEPLKKSLHGLFQSASALLLVRNRAGGAPKGQPIGDCQLKTSFQTPFKSMRFAS